MDDKSDLEFAREQRDEWEDDAKNWRRLYESAGAELTDCTERGVAQVRRAERAEGELAALEAEVERLRGAVSAKCKECEDLISLEKGDLPEWCRNYQGHCPLLPLRPADPGADD